MANTETKDPWESYPEPKRGGDLRERGSHYPMTRRDSESSHRVDTFREPRGRAAGSISLTASSTPSRDKDKERIGKEIESIFESPDIHFASSRTDEIITEYNNIYPKSCERLEEGIEDALACYQFPESLEEKSENHQYAGAPA